MKNMGKDGGKMQGHISKMDRESLFQEIRNALLRWPELERGIFSQAHYNGKSPEDISRSVKLGVKEVSAILKDCDRRLNASIRKHPQITCQ
jgi:DNA-directed RNA polymerase specialized sigma24 family protein